MLNNTYRSHEFVNILSRIEADKGIVFNYADNQKLKKSGFAVEGKTVNGFVDTNTGAVTLNVQSAKSWQSVVGHEITHVLEGTDAYEPMQKALYAYAESKGELASRRGEITELTDKVYFQNDYTQSEFDEWQELDKKLENKSVEPKKLGDLIEHKKLFEAYPQLQEISVVYESGLGNTRGVYNSVFNEIVLNNNLRFNPEQFKKTLVHEIQHAIQDIEGFAYGSSPEYWESAKHRYTAKEKEQTEQLKWDIYNMERAVKKEFGSEAWENIVKYKILEEIYFEEDIDTESLEKQLEDIENEAKEQGYNEWFDKYYYAKSDLDSIDRRVERRKHRSNNDLYLNTAGEIEARDVSNRVDLTEEQRKNTQPDINRMGVVFSDYGTESNSIGYTTNGEPVLVVNDDILRDARTDKEIVDVVKQYIGRFKTIPIRGQKNFFTSKSKKNM